MTRFLAATVLGATLALSVSVQAANLAQPPQRPQAKPEPNRPPICNTQKSARYLPGVDAYGRPVAPADVPSGPEVYIGTTVYPEIGFKDPLLRGAVVGVRIGGFTDPPLCQPRSRNIHNAS